MSAIDHITLQVADPAAAERFYHNAFGLDGWAGPVRACAGDEPSSGFRGFSISLVVDRPSTVDALVAAATAAGAVVVTPVARSFWGYGGVVRDPDGNLWKVATSAKRDRGPATGRVERVVLLLGVADVKASKRFYADAGLRVAKSFGGKYAEFEPAGSPLTLALYPRRAAAKDAGVAPEGTGSHRIVVVGDLGVGAADPDGFVWRTSPVQQSA